MIVLVTIDTLCDEIWILKLGKVQPEDEGGSGEGGVGEDVEEPDAEEGEDVLHVVQVSPTHSLNILVHPGLVRK